MGVLKIPKDGCRANLESDQDGMCLVHQSHNHGSLLHGLLCVFDLEYPTLWRAVTDLEVSMLLLSRGLPGARLTR